LLQGACIALLYYIGAKVGLAYAVVGGAVSLVWPPSGIALVALLAFGRRLAPGVAVGSFLANLSVGVPPLVSASVATGATLAAVTATLLLEQVAQFQLALNRTRDVLALIILAATLSTSVSALIGATALLVGGLIPATEYGPAFLKWWLGDMMGVLVVAPPLLAWRAYPHPLDSSWKALEALGLATTLGIVGHLIFGAPELAGHGYYPAALAIFPFIIWAALRFGHWGTSLATFAVSIIAVWGTTQGTGPLAGNSPVDSLVRWCTFVNVLAGTGLLLVAAHAEEQHALGLLQASHDELERRIQARTADLKKANEDLKQQMAGRRLLEGKLIRVGDQQQRLIGRELHDGLGQHLTSIGLYCATLNQKLHAQGRPEAQDAARILTLVKQASEMTRTIARGLDPAALESGGLTAALHSLAETTRSLKGMDCVLRADPKVEVPDSLVAINLYRVAQEAINNALKYSQAHHLWIDLDEVDGMQRLSISDDGVGIDPELAERGQGLGLHNLRHRAKLLGGTCAVTRNTLGGTTISISYPVTEDALHERDYT
jgi:signal transduction histidine kinase